MDAKAYKGWPGLVLTPMPTTALPHGGGSAMPLFSRKVATKVTSLMNLLKCYWPMAFVLGEHLTTNCTTSGMRALTPMGGCGRFVGPRGDNN